MKNSGQIVLILIIVILIIIADIIIDNFTKNVVDLMTSKLDKIDKLLENGEYPIDETQELIDEWKNKEKIIACYLEHDEIEEIETKINLLKRQIEIDDYDDARQCVVEVSLLFDHISDRQKLNLKNFF